MMNLLQWSKEKKMTQGDKPEYLKSGVAIFWGREGWREQNTQFWRKDYEIRFDLLHFILPIRKKNVLYAHLDIVVYTLQDRFDQDIKVRKISFDGIYVICKPLN